MFCSYAENIFICFRRIFVLLQTEIAVCSEIIHICHPHLHQIQLLILTDIIVDKCDAFLIFSLIIESICILIITLQRRGDQL